MKARNRHTANYLHGRERNRAGLAFEKSPSNSWAGRQRASLLYFSLHFTFSSRAMLGRAGPLLGTRRSSRHTAGTAGAVCSRDRWDTNSASREGTVLARGAIGYLSCRRKAGSRTRCQNVPVSGNDSRNDGRNWCSLSRGGCGGTRARGSVRCGSRSADTASRSR